MRIPPLCLSILLLPIPRLQGQPAAAGQYSSGQDYQAVQYTSDNGLPQNTVNDLLFDRNHFLWIATHNGLVRFDGQRFNVFNTSNTPVLKSNRFPLLSQTVDGKMLVKSSFDDSVIYNITAGYGIEKDSQYTRWRKKLITYHSNGVFDYDQFEANAAGKGRDTALPALLDRLYHSGFYWVFNEHEAVIADTADYYYVNGRAGTLSKLPRCWGKKDHPRGIVIGDLFGIVRNNGNVVFFRAGLPVDIRSGDLVRRLLCGFEGLSDEQFFIHVKGGRSILRRNNDFYSLSITGGILCATLLFGHLSFLGNQPIYAMQYDSALKLLALGTQNAGLWLVRNPFFHTMTFASPDMISNIIMCTQLLPRGRILTSNGIMNASDASKSVVFPSDQKFDRYCVYRSRDNSLWCSRGNWLYRYDASFSTGERVGNEALDSYVTAIAEDKSGAFWVATTSSVLKLENGRLLTVLNRYPAFVNHTIESIANVSSNKLWIATRNGLYELDKLTGRLQPTPLLADVYVRTIFKARDGSLWIGTYGNGYFAFREGRFCPMPLDADRYLEEAHAFCEDHQGNFWISTNHGLFKMLKADLDSIAEGHNRQPYMYYYDKTCGLETNEFNGGCNPSALEDSLGRFYLPSMKGIVTFSPDSCSPELPDKALVIDEMSVDSSRADYHGVTRVRADFTRIVVRVSTPFYGSPENLRVEYSFSPNMWYPVNRDGKIEINRLPAGVYQLFIRKTNGWGKDNYSTSIIRFRVLPFWYNTPIFWILLWLAFLYLAVQVRTRILRRQNLRLQVKVDQRTHELEKSTLIKEHLLSIIMHDIRSPLNAQNRLIEDIVLHLKKINPARLKYLLSEVLESGRSILQFSADFLVWYDSQREDFSVEKRLVALLPFLTATLDFYQQTAKRQGITLSLDVPEEITLVTDEHLLAIVIRNIVDNAIKHTPKGSIRVSASTNQNGVLIQVRDTGRGMSAEMVKELREPTAVGRNKGNSFGYRFIREFTQWLGGRLHIDSEKGVGTTISLRFFNDPPVSNSPPSTICVCPSR
jgi:signal transduction histidine kinase